MGLAPPTSPRTHILGAKLGSEPDVLELAHHGEHAHKAHGTRHETLQNDLHGRQGGRIEMNTAVVSTKASRMQQSPSYICTHVGLNVYDQYCTVVWRGCWMWYI